MNILVTGANGQLGNELRILSAGSAHRFVFTDIASVSEDSLSKLVRLGGPSVPTGTTILDVTDAAAVRSLVSSARIDAVVNCAAYTDVEGAEDHEELARKLNAGAPQILAGAMKESGGLLVHVSTDYVFGGVKYNTPCSEDLEGAPTGVYGRTKLEGERAILSSGCRSVIVRTSWLYSEFGKNFCRTMLRLTAEKPEVRVVFDQAGTPTYALDLARAIVSILDAPREGIYNFSNEGVCSWYDFALAIRDLSGHHGCVVSPCHTGEFPTRVVRPAYSVLDKSRIKTTFGIDVPYWTDSLKQCLNNL